MSISKIIQLIIAIGLFVIFLIFPIFPQDRNSSYMFAVVILMGFFWLAEIIPLGITSLMPIFLFPILQIDTTAKVTTNYINSTIFLFLGGFFLSISMEKWNLHRRIALSILNIIGTSKYKIIFGFTIATTLMSMFLSNTATAMIMLPIAIAIITKVEDNVSKKDSHKFSVALLLTIAYSASIGGIATIIGTPPNLVLMRIYKITFPNLPDITFANWLVYGIPLAFGMTILLLIIISLSYLKQLPNNLLSKSEIDYQLAELGKIQDVEKKILAIFGTVVLLWIFREPIALGSFTIPGWANLIGLSKFIDDGTIAIAGAFLLFLLPVNFKDISKKILDKDAIKKVPWEIILLFGGGFALADGFETSGLSKEIAIHLQYLGNLPLFLNLLIISFIVVALTEFSSNTATAATMLPVIASLSQVIHINPLVLMIPATISASLAFMLPISTPPNAIVFSTGHIKIKEMAKTGIILNILGIIYVVVFFSFIQ